VTTLTDLARRLNLAGGTGVRRVPGLILMTDRTRLPDPTAAIAALPRGSAVILRDYDDPDRRVLAERLANLCRRRRVRLLIGADAGLARSVGAAGIHLPEALITRAAAIRRRPGWLVTGAAHSPGALQRAVTAGVDAVLLAPVLATASHPEAPPIGPWRFAAWCRRSPIPVYALGGVTADQAVRLQHSGAAGFAATGALALAPSGLLGPNCLTLP
jgi:thiamine-phosphate pyrophosphorylase